MSRYRAPAGSRPPCSQQYFIAMAAYLYELAEAASISTRRQNHSAALPEANPHKSVTRTMARERYFVTIFQKPPRLARWQLQRFVPAPGQLEQAPAILLLRPGNRSARDQIARAQVASVRCVMRHHLRRCPVHMAECCFAQPYRFPQPRRLQKHLQLNIESALRRPQIPERRCFMRRRFRPKWLQRFERNHPRRNAGREIFRQKRAERLIFPALNIARRPVVQQTKTRDVFLRPADRDRLAQRVPWSREETYFEFVIEFRGRTKAPFTQLPQRPPYARPARHNGRSAPMIRDRNMFVVRQQRIVGAKHPAHIRRVVNGGVEIGVVADCAGQQHLRLALCNQFALGRARCERVAECAPQIAPFRRREGAINVQRLARQPFRDRQNKFADRCPEPQACFVARAKNTQREILNRKIAARFVGGFHPASPLRRMRLIGHRSAVARSRQHHYNSITQRANGATCPPTSMPSAPFFPFN